SGRPGIHSRAGRLTPARTRSPPLSPNCQEGGALAVPTAPSAAGDRVAQPHQTAGHLPRKGTATTRITPGKPVAVDDRPATWGATRTTLDGDAIHRTPRQGQRERLPSRAVPPAITPAPGGLTGPGGTPTTLRREPCLSTPSAPSLAQRSSATSKPGIMASM